MFGKFLWQYFRKIFAHMKGRIRSDVCGEMRFGSIDKASCKEVVPDLGQAMMIKGFFMVMFRYPAKRISSIIHK